MDGELGDRIRALEERFELTAADLRVADDRYERGVHPDEEKAQAADAEKVLEELCDLLDWFIDKYGVGVNRVDPRRQAQGMRGVVSRSFSGRFSWARKMNPHNGIVRA